ncbi:hypothetical protein [Frondihabitans sucicola]|nr:hypothetical protein [Frondihabitans sucicola]
MDETTPPADGLKTFTADPSAEKHHIDAPCPMCGHQGMTVAPRLTAKPLGSYSLAGVQMKFSATSEMWITCDAGCGFEEKGKRG